MYILTEQGIRECERFIAECNAKRKEILDAKLDTADYTNLPTIEAIESDIEGFLDEDGDYYNRWGVTDNYSSDFPICLTLGIHFIKKLKPDITAIRMVKTMRGNETTKKFLYKLMEYRFVYRLMPRWAKFMYCFDIMLKNNSGRLHLNNGYLLNFETMTIEPVDCYECALWKLGKEDGTCIHYINNDCPCGYHDTDEGENDEALD